MQIQKNQKISKIEDAKLILDYFEHLEIALNSNEVLRFKHHLALETAQDSLKEALQHIEYLAEYLLKTEKDDFFESGSYLEKGLTIEEHNDLLFESNHIFVVAVRFLGKSIFEYGVKRIERKRIDLFKLEKAIIASQKFQSKKPEDSQIDSSVLNKSGKDILYINISYDMGPMQNRSEIIEFSISETGECLFKTGRGFKIGDPGEDAYIESCTRSLWHTINDIVKNFN